MRKLQFTAGAGSAVFIGGLVDCVVGDRLEKFNSSIFFWGALTGICALTTTRSIHFLIRGRSPVRYPSGSPHLGAIKRPAGCVLHRTTSYEAGIYTVSAIVGPFPTLYCLSKTIEILNQHIVY
jgi:hypothetical protein